MPGHGMRGILIGTARRGHGHGGRRGVGVRHGRGAGDPLGLGDQAGDGVLHGALLGEARPGDGILVETGLGRAPAAIRLTVAGLQESETDTQACTQTAMLRTAVSTV